MARSRCHVMAVFGGAGGIRHNSHIREMVNMRNMLRMFVAEGDVTLANANHGMACLMLQAAARASAAEVLRYMYANVGNRYGEFVAGVQVRQTTVILR